MRKPAWRVFEGLYFRALEHKSHNRFTRVGIIAHQAERGLPMLGNGLARSHRPPQPVVGIRPRRGATVGGGTASRRILRIPLVEQRVDRMRKLALTACLATLVAATPALADGKGRGSPADSPRHWQVSDDFRQSLSRVIRGIWRSESFGPPPGFSSPGRHDGWFRGKHWGWFKPHNPRWPHHPPVSP